MTTDTLNDEALWQAIAAHDDGRAFAALYDRYWRKVYRTANYYLRDAHQARQILHDVFVILWEKRQTLQIDNFNAYLCVAARYHVFSYLRASKKVSPVEYIENYNGINNEAVKNTAEVQHGHDDLEYHLMQLLNNLPKRCREIFWMSRVEQLTNDEIAEKLGISKRTVENQLTHALKHLRLSYSHLHGALLLVVLIFSAL